MALTGITSSGLTPAMQRQIQNVAKNGGTIDIGKLLVSQGVSIASNNSSPWVDFLTQLPQIMLAAIFGTNNTSTTNNVASTSNTTSTEKISRL